MALYLKDANYINWQTLAITRGNLRVEESGRDLLQMDVDSKQGDRIIDLKGKFVTKSFVCGHHHAYSALARGMPFPSQVPANFCQILEYIWWNLDKKLDSDMIRASALVTAINSLKSGVTFVIDHHSSPFAIDGSLEIIADAFTQLGVGHLLCLELSDRDGESVAEKGLAATEKFIANSAYQGLVGLHASFTVGDELLNRSVELARKYNSGIHIHTAEDLFDQMNTLDRYKQRVITRLDQAGALDMPKTILAHALHIDKSEREIFNKSRAFIAVNTESNLNNAVGSFSAQGLDSSRIFLGTDGMHSDMIQSAKAHYFQTHSQEGSTPMDVYQRLRNVHGYLESNSFRGDGDNNLVIFNYDTPTPVTTDNFLGHLFYGMSSNHVESVIANGKLVVENRQVTMVNEEEILNFSKEQALRLWKKL